MPKFEHQFKGNGLWEIIWRFPCQQKVLMVTDRNPGFGLDFGTSGFGLSEFVDIVKNAGHAVDTAHRNGDVNATISGNFNFASAAKPVTTANYDQIWLFGFNTVALSAAEQTAIA